MAKYSGKKCRLLSMMWLTAFFFFVEIIVGYVTNSMALVADSFHMLGDIAALVISFLSVKVGPYPRLFKAISNMSSIPTDVTQEVVEEHLWMGPGRGSGSARQRRLPGGPLLQHHHRGVQTVSGFSQWISIGSNYGSMIRTQSQLRANL